ncbi:hypothetical protein CMO88_00510 [Candidatus Woesearchaeota archaeon]|nr:hypothetical protein [Candidatus Woesearchaeota archaeon]
MEPTPVAAEKTEDVPESVSENIKLTLLNDSFCYESLGGIRADIEGDENTFYNVDLNVTKANEGKVVYGTLTDNGGGSVSVGFSSKRLEPGTYNASAAFITSNGSIVERRRSFDVVKCTDDLGNAFQRTESDGITLKVSEDSRVGEKTRIVVNPLSGKKFQYVDIFVYNKDEELNPISLTSVEGGPVSFIFEPSQTGTYRVEARVGKDALLAKNFEVE